MLKRALVISILILVTVAATLPIGESLASYGRRAVASRTGKAKAKRRSRAWWRRRRAHLRRQRAVAASRRRQQRAWALRRRRGTSARLYRPRRGNSARRADLPAGTANLRTLLAPARLPSVSMSAVEAIPAITERAASAPVFTPVIAPVAVTLAAAPVTNPDPLPATKSAKAHAAPAKAHAAPAKAHAAPAKAHAAPALAHAAPVAAAVVVPRPLVPAASPSPFLRAAPLAGPSPFKPSAASAAPVARDARKFSSLPVPRTWQNVSSTLGGEFKFSLRGADNRAVGTAVWSRLALAPSAALDRRSKTLGGVTHAALRRTVIDRMVAEGGWVVNDFEREMDGRRVFVVIAQSEGEGGVRRNWTYYFTETDGQLYSLATTAPAQFADAVAADAEAVVSSVHSRARAAVATPPVKN